MANREEFVQKHRPSGHKVFVQGLEKYRWVFSCGATRDLTMNSDIWLGVKIQWHKHYKEVFGD